MYTLKQLIDALIEQQKIHGDKPMIVWVNNCAPCEGVSDVYTNGDGCVEIVLE